MKILTIMDKHYRFFIFIRNELNNNKEVFKSKELQAQIVRYMQMEWFYEHWTLIVSITYEKGILK